MNSFTLGHKRTKIIVPNSPPIAPNSISVCVSPPLLGWGIVVRDVEATTLCVIDGVAIVD